MQLWVAQPVSNPPTPSWQPIKYSAPFVLSLTLSPKLGRLVGIWSGTTSDLPDYLDYPHHESSPAMSVAPPIRNDIELEYARKLLPTSVYPKTTEGMGCWVLDFTRI